MEAVGLSIAGPQILTTRRCGRRDVGTARAAAHRGSGGRPPAIAKRSAAGRRRSSPLVNRSRRHPPRLDESTRRVLGRTAPRERDGSSDPPAARRPGDAGRPGRGGVAPSGTRDPSAPPGHPGGRGAGIDHLREHRGAADGRPRNDRRGARRPPSGEACAQDAFLRGAAFFFGAAFLRAAGFFLPPLASFSAIHSTACSIVTSSGAVPLGIVALTLSHFT